MQRFLSFIALCLAPALFAAGEKSATFTVEQIDSVAPVFPTRAFARFVLERLDDFAWENDKVGPSRGCGGTGIWDGRTLAVSRNYQTWRVLANGPVRSVFELTYAAWEAHGLKVAETKRFTVDAGHNLDLIESTFTVVAGTATELTVAVGLNKTPADKGQDAKIAVTPSPAHGAVTQWIEQKTNGALGTAVIVAADAFAGLAEDERNQLALAKAVPGRPLRYLAGAGWSKAGEFTTRHAWNDYVAACAQRLAAPVRITFEK